MIRWLCLVLLAGCGAVDYAGAPVGRFDGSLFVMWVGEGDDQAGAGRFVFVPSRTPLTFTRLRPDGTDQVIAPGMMYTDGGSIPRVAQVFRGFSPWGYSPAYMVHDWLFKAHRCVTDGMADANEQTVAGLSFQDSAAILAEAIKTLIAENKVRADDIAPMAISAAVAGPAARQLWDQRGACAAGAISSDHLDQIRRALPGVVAARGLRAPDPGPKAVIVAEIAF
jgi:hypothetical protein